MEVGMSIKCPNCPYSYKVSKVGEKQASGDGDMGGTLLIVVLLVIPCFFVGYLAGMRFLYYIGWFFLALTLVYNLWLMNYDKKTVPIYRCNVCGYEW